MKKVRSARAAALVCVVGTACGVGYAVVVATTGWEPSLGFAFQALLHLAELAEVIGLALAGAAGAGWLGYVGLGAAVLGEVLLTVATQAARMSASSYSTSRRRCPGSVWCWPGSPCCGPDAGRAGSGSRR